MYVPPKNQPVDRRQRSQRDRPTSVVIAVCLMFSAVATDSASFVFSLMAPDAERGLSFVVLAAVAPVLMAALAYGVWKGSTRVWALYILISALGIVSNLLALPDWATRFTTVPFAATLDAAGQILRYAALILLLLPSSSQWFRGADNGQGEDKPVARDDNDHVHTQVSHATPKSRRDRRRPSGPRVAAPRKEQEHEKHEGRRRRRRRREGFHIGVHFIAYDDWTLFVSVAAGLTASIILGAISTLVFAIGMLNLYSFYVMPIQILIVVIATSMAALLGRLAGNTTKFAIWGTWLSCPASALFGLYSGWLLRGYY